VQRRFPHRIILVAATGVLWADPNRSFPGWTVHPSTLGSIVEESVEECEVVHTSENKVHLIQHAPIPYGCGAKISPMPALGNRDRPNAEGQAK